MQEMKMYYYWPNYILWLLINYRKHFFFFTRRLLTSLTEPKWNKTIKTPKQSDKQTNKTNQKKRKNPEKELCPHHS